MAERNNATEERSFTGARDTTTRRRKLFSIVNGWRRPRGRPANDLRRCVANDVRMKTEEFNNAEQDRG